MSYKSVLIWGCVTAVAVGLIVGAIFGVHKLLTVYLCVFLGAIVASVILSGALISGDRTRANFYTEVAEDRHNRNRLISKILLFALPYAIIAGALYYVSAG